MTVDGELMITNMKMLNALKTQAEEITRLTKIIDDLSEPNLPLDVEGAGASGTASGPPNGTTCGNGIVGGRGGRVAYGGIGGGAG